MSAMKSNKLAESAHSSVVPSRSIRVVSNAVAHGFERSLSEQAIDERDS